MAAAAIGGPTTVAAACGRSTVATAGPTTAPPDTTAGFSMAASARSISRTISAYSFATLSSSPERVVFHNYRHSLSDFSHLQRDGFPNFGDIVRATHVQSLEIEKQNATRQRLVDR
jgi:hypothetical protein